ncbi:hypothetical protein SAMN04487916_11140 [Arthrobacter sp. ov407]|uniref:DUF6707 family protein n=1 Tax=Arthrobacter sp. ov407 TaxID=1761748 RepID=UPI0008817364|nr:DUF6707 family protein [Arthrobacter sp. ov407]SDL59542.1 hypothetical protein SAMN04487916_11140 [Arthrobacter sp. ov407]
MTHPPASRNYSEQQAGSLRAGDHLILPDGNRSAEIHRVDVQTDDFGTPAMVLATLSGGGVLRIAAGSLVRVTDDAEPDTPTASDTDDDDGASGAPAGSDDADDSASGAPELPASGPSPEPEEEVSDAAESDNTTAAVVVPPQPVAPPAVSGPSEADLALIPAPDGTPESVVEAAAEAHPGAVGVLLLSERLAKGINTKSGSCLKDLSDLAHELFVTLKDAENALAVADLLNVLPFDGNPDRWASVESSLALSSYMCRQLGQDQRAGIYEKMLRAPEAMETDPFKARINAKVRQRSLNEPNLYDKEIFRSIDNANPDAERDWRLLRLEALLFLRAHGGSETIGAAELERRIGNELESVRA